MDPKNGRAEMEKANLSGDPTKTAHARVSVAAMWRPTGIS